MIEIKDVTKEYRNDKEATLALDGISMTIRDGELVAIMGESGCGKTTLLNLIGGLDSATSGSVIVDGDEISGYRGAKLEKYRKNKVSFVFQNFELMEYYSVYENVEMPLLVRRLSAKEKRTRIKDNLKKVGLWDIRRKYPWQLSGGQQQRVAIARALAIGNPILLADEPTGALDSKTSAQLMEIFKEINGGGTTVIIVTHSEQVAKACDRVIRMEDGKVAED